MAALLLAAVHGALVEAGVAPGRVRGGDTLVSGCWESGQSGVGASASARREKASSPSETRRSVTPRNDREAGAIHHVAK